MPGSITMFGNYSGSSLVPTTTRAPLHISAGFGNPARRSTSGARSNTLPLPWEDNAFSNIGMDVPEVLPPDVSPLAPSVLEAGRTNIESMLRGEVPQDVLDLVEQASAERGLQGGLNGQIATNRTARDFGRTSLDLITQGVQLGSSLSADELARAQYQEAAAQWRTQLQEQQTQWRKTFEFGLAQADLSAQQWQQTFNQGSNATNAQLTMAGQQMIMQNEQFAQSLAMGLVQANSQNRIAGIQQIIDSILGQNGIAGFGFDLNQAIMNLIQSI